MIDNATLVLRRYPEYLGCTPGELWFDNKQICYTIERPWLKNKSNVSCIPLGQYPISISYSAKFKTPLPEIHQVPDRTGIRIHAANVVEELAGCIATAGELTISTGRVVGVRSGMTLTTIMQMFRVQKISTIHIETMYTS